MTGDDLRDAYEHAQLRRERVRLRSAVRRLRKFAMWCISEESDGRDLGVKAREVLRETDGVL